MVKRQLVLGQPGQVGLKVQPYHVVSMTSVEFLIKLPTSLIVALLSEWLDVGALGRLDSAACQHVDRPKILELYHAEDLTLCNIPPYIQTCLLTWSMLRGVKVSHLVVTQNTNKETLSAFLHHRKSHIRSLTFDGASQQAALLAVSCHHLRYLCFAVEENGVSLRNILQNNPNLEELRLSKCMQRRSSSNCTSIFQATRLPQLTTLSVNLADDTALIAALNMSDRLLKLNLFGEMFVSVSKNIIAAIAARCPHLRSLGLSGIAVNNTDIATLTESCPHVVNVEIGVCMAFDDMGMLIMVKNWQLRSLHLHVSVLTDLSMQYLAQHCAETLQVVKLTGFMGQPAIERMQQQCTKLHTFHWCSGWNGSSQLYAADQTTVVKVLRSGPFTDRALVILAQYKQLRILDVRCMGGYDEDEQITQAGLDEFLAHCRQLHTIVASKANITMLRGFVRDNPRVRVTTDGSVYEFDLLSMPI